MNLKDIETGDLLIQSFSGFSTSLIKIGTLSNCNHVSVALRISPEFLPKIKIVKTGGVLCLLESICPFTTVFADIKKRLVIYNFPLEHNKRFILRKLKYYNQEFYQKCIHFLERHVEYFYMSYDIGNKNIEINKKQKITEFIDSQNIIIPENPRKSLHLLSSKTTNFCSELVYSFYEYTLNSYNFKSDEAIVYPHHFLTYKYDNFFGESVVIVDNLNSVPLYLTILILIIIIILVYLYFNGYIKSIYFLYLLILIIFLIIIFK